ncbi:MAG: CDP-alcohol phosphatidyltransferase family protein [Spirochaetaceae bacterium]
MIERPMRKLKHYLLFPFATWTGRFVGPMPITLLALLIGLVCALAAALEATMWALVLWIVNRMVDGLDGEVARARGDASDLGGYVDMMSDVIVYATIPPAVAYAHGDPRITAAILVMLAAFYVNITSWTYLSALLEKRRNTSGTHSTSIEMPWGVIEGTETTVVYALLLGAPTIVVEVALVAAAAGFISSVQRIVWAVHAIRN